MSSESNKHIWNSASRFGRRCLTRATRACLCLNASEEKLIEEDTALPGIEHAAGLHVTYKDLSDNLTDAGPRLADAIFDDPELVHKFKTVDADGNEHINIIFCGKWMKSLAELEGLVMLAIDMISGAPPRGTELVSMLARNSLTRLCKQ
ncbi:hypothetical protein B0H10DRAFT_2222977 [Mycena sp. CBHHK59/15]|nr:hypothetical protein B0H10DRAFT_2222977 [Mycena sp. CBHHK59/15]